MKKILHYCLIGFLPAFVSTARLHANTPHICSSNVKSNITSKLSQAFQCQLLRLKMIKDAFNSDDIAIAFSDQGTLTYNNQLDSRYMPGIEAPEGFFCFSTDSVPLSVNIIPLPKQAPLKIRLDVEAANSGCFTMQKTKLDSIPAVYDLWLVDKYKKDSLNLRTGTNYFFSINKTDSSSFGSNRFEVVVKQKDAPVFKLLNFAAVKTPVGAQITWNTSAEENNTGFIVQRSVDGGANYFMLTTMMSDSSGHYTFSDKGPVTGVDTYRLKVTDMSGTVSYSTTATLNFTQTTSNFANFTIYPNPSIGVINLTIKPRTEVSAPGAVDNAQQNNASVKALNVNSYTIKIMNLTGSVLTTSSSASSSWQGSVSTLTPGTYVVRVLNNFDNSLVGSSTFVKL